jgi:aminoglycoside phosphotransferase (APT) family kinase protein
LRADRSPLVPSHGDFHPKNVLLCDQWVAVIDFDHFGRRVPAFDIGYAIGQLYIMSYLRLGDFASGANASAAFWNRCHLAGRARWSDVAVHVARTFMQSLHYELYVLKTGQTALVPLWLRMAETFLASDDLPERQRLQTLASTNGGYQ